MIEAKRHNKYPGRVELTLLQHEHNIRGKKPEMRQKQCVFDPRNSAPKVKEYYNHVFGAYATPRENAENPDFIRLS